MSYSLKVTYDTGDSFRHEYGLEYIIPKMTWENKAMAEEAAQAIVDHYTYYLKMNRLGYGSKKEQEELLKEIKQLSWYVEPESSGIYTYGGWEWNIKLTNDTGSKVVSCDTWIGYFESLVEVEVIFIPEEQKRFRP